MSARGIVLGVVSPHPPIVVPEIGEEEVERCAATRDGLQQMASLVVETRPDTVVIISPHGPVIRDAITLVATPILEGNFREFGIAGSSLRYGNDLRLVHRTVDEAAKREVNVFPADPERAGSLRLPAALHYSILVPLYYLKQAGYEGRLVAGAAGLLPEEKYLNFGRAVQAASAELGLRVVYIASGDLSHRLTDGAPAGYDPMGKVFDQKVVAALSQGDGQALLDLDPDLVERAGQCGLGPVLTLFGALDGYGLLPQVLSYEGPFGVGYCVATFEPTGPAVKTAAGAAGNEPAGDALEAPEKGAGEPPPEQVAGSGAPHSLVRLARLSLETYVRDGRIVSPPPGCPGLDRRAGAFVSLKKHGELRGCIGTISPTASNLAEEVIRNAVQAGTADPRFSPVEPAELGELVYSVDVLEPAEPISSMEDLDPKAYGLIVSKGRRTGLLLPDLEGIDTVEDQVAIAMRKAGIPMDETGVTLFRFKVSRYH